jgi:para-nitrobenzyl esterase
VRTNIIETASGRLSGILKDGIGQFPGIPYGAPTAHARFQQATAAIPWSGVKECTEFGPQALQGHLGVAGMTMTGGENRKTVADILGVSPVGVAPPQSEDCLFLNVFAPEILVQGSPRPVMVWLHGGGFSQGTASSWHYDGSGLSRQGDVIVVTVNHRLSAPGYLYLDGFHDIFADSHNIGQFDIILALHWVRDNIAAFGGDPANVTVFGESGGGAKVSALLAMPAATGLFTKAIIQSGPSAEMVEPWDAREITERTIAALGICWGDADALLKADPRQIIDATSITLQPGNGIIKGSLAPVMDGTTMPAHPFSETVLRNMVVPLMIGSTRDEWSLMCALDPLFGTMTADEARGRFADLAGVDADRYLAFYRSLRPAGPPTSWYVDFTTDVMMKTELAQMAESHRRAAPGPLYVYRLDWPSPAAGGALGCPHGADIPFVFNNVDAAPAFAGTGDGARRLGVIMSTAWSNFARSGDPSQPGLEWPRFGKDRQTMLFDAECTVASDPDRARRLFWEAVPVY